MNVHYLRNHKVRGHVIRLLSLERNYLVGFRVRFGAVGLGGHVVLCWGCATLLRAINEVQLCPYQPNPSIYGITLSPKRGVCGKSGVAVTSARPWSDLPKPSASQCFAILPNKCEGRFLLHKRGCFLSYNKYRLTFRQCRWPRAFVGSSGKRWLCSA